MFSTYILTLLLSTAGATTLTPLPSGPTTPLPIQQGGGDNYPCDQIADKLAAYSDLARTQHDSITSFLTQISDRVTSWYNALSPLEGTAQTLDVGTFQPLQDGAQQISTVTDAAYDNYQALQDEMDRIVVSLKACAVSASRSTTK